MKRKTVAAAALDKAARLAARRKKPYRGKYGVHTSFGFVPSYESPLVLARRIRANRKKSDAFRAQCLADGIDYDEIMAWLRGAFKIEVKK